MIMLEGYVSFDERQQEKAAARRRDLRRLESGEIKPAQLEGRNGFFSVLDRSEARLIARRVRVKVA